MIISRIAIVLFIVFISCNNSNSPSGNNVSVEAEAHFSMSTHDLIDFTEAIVQYPHATIKELELIFNLLYRCDRPSNFHYYPPHYDGLHLESDEMKWFIETVKDKREADDQMLLYVYMSSTISRESITYFMLYSICKLDELGKGITPNRNYTIKNLLHHYYPENLKQSDDEAFLKAISEAIQSDEPLDLEVRPPY